MMNVYDIDDIKNPPTTNDANNSNLSLKFIND